MKQDPAETVKGPTPQAPDDTEATPTVAAAGAPALQADPASIGPYRILGRLGEGGMGVVLDAEQIEPIRRRVAIKIIKPGMDSRQVLRRFEAERQTLAMLNHPNVARVLDAGATAAGLPYFVMEHVSGRHVTAYCDLEELGIEARLRLFLQVCDALQHAHMKGVIHRDLKPSNVLVADQDGRATPKVIDFGIAKALSPEAGTEHTEQGQIIGTPQYMSPEQATGRDVDTRTDVYSLGVILYELLTGSAPLDPSSLTGRNPVELQRAICETEPPRPSARITGLESQSESQSEASARLRGHDPRSLARRLRGDLDWITMKALEKDRERRYSTAAALGQDLERHLAGEPVLARPPSASYRLGKFARRHRVAVLAASVVLLALVAGVATTSWQAVRARQAERRAVAERAEALRQAAIAEAVNRFLNEDLLAAAAPDKQGIDVTVRQVLEVAAKGVEGRFEGQPEVEAALRQTLGNTFKKLGELGPAEDHLTRSVALLEQTLGAEHPAILGSKRDLAVLLLQTSRFEEGVALAEEVLAARRRLLGDDDPKTVISIGDLAAGQYRLGDHDRAQALFEEALERQRRILGENDRAVLISMSNLATFYAERGQLEKAAELQAESLSRTRDRLGEEHPDTLNSLANYGHTLAQLGRLPEAEQMLTQALALSRRVNGPAHPDTLYTMNALASLYKRLERPDEAVDLFRETLALRRRALGNDHTSTSTSMHNLAGLYRKLGRLREAEPLAREALRVVIKNHGDAHSKTVSFKNNLALVVAGLGRHGEALTLQREVVAGATAVFGAEDLRVGEYRLNLGRTLALLRRHAEAEKELLEAHRILRAAGEDGHDGTDEAAAALAQLYEAWGRPSARE